MIQILHFLFALNVFAAALAGAIHFKIVRKVRHLSFAYFGWSLAGQIIALPLMLLTSILLYVALSGNGISIVIAAIHLLTLPLLALILWRSWQSSRVLAEIVTDNGRISFTSFLFGALFPFRLIKRDIERIKNIVYGPAGRRNNLDIYRPKNMPARPMPVLIQVHGGGWVVGRKHQQARPLISHMASNGWLVVDINYRLGPRAKMPAMVQDVLRSVAWVKSNIASYNGDPSFVALTGGSAGGHLVALAALASGVNAFKPGFENIDCSVDACVPVYGLYDLLDESGAMHDGQKELQSFMEVLVMPEVRDTPSPLWQQISPITHISKDAPPMLLLHGQHDALADFESAKAFAEALESKSKNEVIFAELPGMQHAYDIAHTPPTPEHVRAIYRFLENVHSLSKLHQFS
jgi:acetyl esterase/lipase